uniref:Uncharacterized protein n=1 Tax=Arundo donax TaxID=35708 RepID=A0A0A9APD7_ARUDO
MLHSWCNLIFPSHALKKSDSFVNLPTMSTSRYQSKECYMIWLESFLLHTA